jgi:hypothetical protein
MSDILSSASLLLAIITALYGLFYPDIIKILDIIPAVHAVDNKPHFIKAKEIRNTKLFPLLLASIILTLTFMPEFLHQIKTALELYCKLGFAFDTYNTVIASFMVVCIFMIVLSISIVILSVRYYNKMKVLNPDKKMKV